MRQTFWRRHRRLKWLALSCLAFLVLLTIAGAIVARHVEPFLRELIVSRLEQRFHAPVELDSFHISLARGLRAEGRGLRIWPPAQVAGMAAGENAPGKPLIELAEFSFHAPLHYASGKPIRISSIELRGLSIDIPPKSHFMHAAGTLSPVSPQAVQGETAQQAAAGPQGKTGSQPAGPPGADLLRFVVDSIVCRGATVRLENSNSAKSPLEFDIQSLKVAHIGSSGSMGFEATLTNPRPRGIIVTRGNLGPWAADDPGTTPVKGSYSFENADLGTFKGISGTLNSTGRYQGTLRNLTVDGMTETPNFALTSFGTAMPLHTDFHARVDGTNGDTWLEPVNATLGHSHFLAQGKIVELPGVAAAGGKPACPGGHEIVLNVDVEDGQIADFLRLTSRNDNPLLTGTLHLKSSLEVLPGPNPVHERLQLKGSFILDDAQFTSQKMQERIGELSQRGQGKPQGAKGAAAADVLSTMTSNFTMKDAVITLPNLVYMVPGAEISLNGRYNVDGGRLDFKGSARMQATVSEMVGGWKGALLKPVDRFFKKDGAGTRIGVHIDGTREDPHFGIDF